MVSFTSSSASVISRMISCAVVFFLTKNGFVCFGGGLEVVAWIVSSPESSSCGFPLACEGFSGQYRLRCPCFLHLKHHPSFWSFSRSSSLRGGRVLVARTLTRPGVVSIASSPFFVNAFFHWSCVGRVSLFLLWNRDLIHKYVV